MNFKDTQYYIAQVKYYLGLAVSAILVDAVVILGILFA